MDFYLFFIVEVTDGIFRQNYAQIDFSRKMLFWIQGTHVWEASSVNLSSFLAWSKTFNGNLLYNDEQMQKIAAKQS